MFRAIVLLAAMLAGCAASPDTEISRDAGVAMQELQTFYLRPNPARSTSAPQTLAAAKREIERAIQDTLVGKGYRRVMDPARADFEIDYVMFVTERYQHGGHDRYLFDDRVRLSSGTESLLSDPIRFGNLHIHFYYQDRPFLEAIASGALGSGTATDKRIRSTVPRMLADIPVSCCR